MPSACRRSICTWLSISATGNAVYAYVMLAEALLQGRGMGQAYNFSNELQVTVLKMVDLIGRLMGRTNLPPLVLNDAPNEIPHQYLSAEKARTQLGWKAQYTLEEGLRDTIEWYEEFFRRRASRGSSSSL